MLITLVVSSYLYIAITYGQHVVKRQLISNREDAAAAAIIYRPRELLRAFRPLLEYFDC